MIGYDKEVIEAFASAWASIDGKMYAFERERETSMPYEHPDYTGTYDGYMVEARELLNRADDRISSFSLADRLCVSRREG